MVLIGAACRLHAALSARRGDSLRHTPRLSRFLRNVLDLSEQPRSVGILVGRCALLVAFALICHTLGAGAALFLQTAPVSALILVGALFAFAFKTSRKRD